MIALTASTPEHELGLLRLAFNANQPEPAPEVPTFDLVAFLWGDLPLMADQRDSTGANTMKYRVRWFSVEPSGTYPVTESAATRNEAIARCKAILAETGSRALVLERGARGKWHVAYDTASGY